MGFLKFKLEKLTIKRADKPSLFSKFEVMFNPESYSQSYKNHYSKFQGLHAASRPTQFAFSEPNELSLTFIFDGTGAYDVGFQKVIKDFLGKYDVQEKIDEFLKMTTIINEDIHEPQLVTLTWGDLDFTGRLIDLDINYKLFDKSGKPLRAEAKANFKAQPKQDVRKKFKSPDVSHRFTVMAGDTLPVLCKKVYGSERYYLKVAAANKLNDFRNLTPGIELWFPPLKID